MPQAVTLTASWAPLRSGVLTTLLYISKDVLAERLWYYYVAAFCLAVWVQASGAGWSDDCVRRREGLARSVIGRRELCW